MLTNRQWDIIPVTWEKFHRKCSRYFSLIGFRKFEILQPHLPGVNELIPCTLSTSRPPDYVRIALVLVLLPPVLPCAIPALIWALKARHDIKHGELQRAWYHSNHAFMTCLFALITLIFLLFGCTVAIFTQSLSTTDTHGKIVLTENRPNSSALFQQVLNNKRVKSSDTTGNGDLRDVVKHRDKASMNKGNEKPRNTSLSTVKPPSWLSNSHWSALSCGSSQEGSEAVLLPGPRFLSLAQSKLRLCSANHRPGHWSNLPCDWPSTAWAYSEQETENRPSFCYQLIAKPGNQTAASQWPDPCHSYFETSEAPFTNRDLQNEHWF